MGTTTRLTTHEVNTMTMMPTMLVVLASLVETSLASRANGDPLDFDNDTWMEHLPLSDLNLQFAEFDLDQTDQWKSTKNITYAEAGVPKLETDNVITSSHKASPSR